tara:strand:+ start:85 stop:429 length:345 start_codon:yes stop_codon:yes gene_type:complete
MSHFEEDEGLGSIDWTGDDEYEAGTNVSVEDLITQIEALPDGKDNLAKGRQWVKDTYYNKSGNVKRRNVMFEFMNITLEGPRWILYAWSLGLFLTGWGLSPILNAILTTLFGEL